MVFLAQQIIKKAFSLNNSWGLQKRRFRVRNWWCCGCCKVKNMD